MPDCLFPIGKNPKNSQCGKSSSDSSCSMSEKQKDNKKGGLKDITAFAMKSLIAIRGSETKICQQLQDRTVNIDLDLVGSQSGGQESLQKDYLEASVRNIDKLRMEIAKRKLKLEELKERRRLNEQRVTPHSTFQREPESNDVVIDFNTKKRKRDYE